MLYFLLFISILFASLNSVLLHKLPEKSNLYIFNMLVSAVWIAILFSLNRFSLTVNSQIIMWGIIYGVTQELFMFFKTQAMKSGSVSITTLIGNCSLILSTSVGVIVWKESVSVLQIFGIFMLITAFILCTYKKSKSEKCSQLWLIYCLLFFTLAAGVGIIFKIFSKLSGGEGAGDMMIVAAFTMFVFSSVKLSVSQITSKSKETTKVFTKSFFIIAVLSGLLSCGYNRLNISLAGLLESVIFYPCFNGGVIILSTLLSIIFLREKLASKQILGLALGILAVVAVGIF